jgi:hypothetical protein
MDGESSASPALDGASRRRSGSWLPAAALALVAVPVVLGIVGAMWLLASHDPAKRVAVGQVISSPGVYRSPDGKITLELESLEGTLLSGTVSMNTANGVMMSFPMAGSKPWFFAFGPDGKVWSYARNYGPTGLHSYEITAKGTRGTTPGENGGWEGVPEEFLRALPEETRAIYEQWLAKQRDGAE